MILNEVIASVGLFDFQVPQVYSMVGAASVLGGVSRMPVPQFPAWKGRDSSCDLRTISLVVIMLELTGGIGSSTIS